MVRLPFNDESGRARRPRRPSPILITDQSERSTLGRLRGWIRNLYGKSHQEGVPKTPAPPNEAKPEPERIVGIESLAPEPLSSHRATVQMLPGRLEPLIPEVIQQEIRFQRAESEEQEVTIGWEHGDPPHHVTLDHPSIQPLHAKMTFQKGNWMIESLAPNHPVEINGTPVLPAAGPYLLAAGDQVRIGEALFRFFLP